MSNTVNFNVTDLRLKDVRLYRDVIQAIGLGELTGDISLVSKSWFEIPEPVRNRLTDYLRTVNPNVDAHIQKASECETYCGCEKCFQKHIAENNAKENARLEVEKQNAPGRARLVEYIKQGLLDDLFNRNAFLTFLDEKFPGLQVIRPDHVDAFVAAKKQELHWKAPESAPSPAPEATVRTLANGESELPLDADEATMRRASIPQLKDLSKRRGEGKSWFKREGRVAGDINTDRQSQVR